MKKKMQKVIKEMMLEERKTYLDDCHTKESEITGVTSFQRIMRVSF